VSLALIVIAAACGAPPSPTPQPSAPTTPSSTVSQICPGPSDGPSIVVTAVEDARRSLAANPSGPVPPACVVGAFARIDGYLPDTLVQQGAALAAEIGRRGTRSREVLAAQVLLAARTHRYSEVLTLYDRLAAVDPQPPTDVPRAAIGAAHQQHDTARLARLLATAEQRPDAPPGVAMELRVLRQQSALLSAIDEARALVRQNPKYLAGYPSLVANFGTLGTADSVTSYLRRALAAGVQRSSLAADLDPFVNTMLRGAALYGRSWSWNGAIASASRVDAEVSTPSTKFLVASLIVQSVEPQMGEVATLVNGASWLPHVPGTDTSVDRAAGCRRIAPLLASLDVAETKLRDGGDHYAGGGASQLHSALSTERRQLGELQTTCQR
jgi:hypothetical protein